MAERQTLPLKILHLLLLAMLMVGCTSQFSMRQTIHREEVTSLDALTQQDKDIFETNWEIAEKLLEQDKMAWIATDSVLPRLGDHQKEMLQGYVTDGSLQNGAVFFFSEKNENEIFIVATAAFSNGIFVEAEIGNMSIPPRIIDKAKCLIKARQINQAYIATQQANYNSYTLDTDNGITVYFAPGSIDGYFILGGGIRSEFDNGLNLKSTTELHKSIVVFEARKIGDIIARSSSVTPVLNEIDILEYLIWKDNIFNQMIVTEKYSFFIYNVPDEGRIIKRAYKKEALKNENATR